MNCRTARKKMEDLLIAGRQSLPAELRTHIENCDSCAREHKILVRTVGLLRREDSWSPTEGFFDQLTRQALAEKQRATTRAEADNLATHLRGSFQWLWTPRAFSWGWASAFVALIMMTTGAWWFVQDYATRTGTMDYVDGMVHSAQGLAFSLVADGQTIREGSAVRTATDAEAIMTLSDNSEVYLASFSELAVQEDRHIELRSGMAWFEVARGEKRFTVDVPSYGEVTVLGTSFGVEVDYERSQCVVSVAGGRVKVESSAGRQILSAGEEAAILLGKAPIKQPPRKLAKMVAFRERLIRKRNERDLKKYYPSLAAPSQRNGER